MAFLAMQKNLNTYKEKQISIKNKRRNFLKVPTKIFTWRFDWSYSNHKYKKKSYQTSVHIKLIYWFWVYFYSSCIPTSHFMLRVLIWIFFDTVRYIYICVKLIDNYIYVTFNFHSKLFIIVKNKYFIHKLYFNLIVVNRLF